MLFHSPAIPALSRKVRSGGNHPSLSVRSRRSADWSGPSAGSASGRTRRREFQVGESFLASTSFQTGTCRFGNSAAFCGISPGYFSTESSAVRQSSKRVSAASSLDCESRTGKALFFPAAAVRNIRSTDGRSADAPPFPSGGRRWGVYEGECPIRGGH